MSDNFYKVVGGTICAIFFVIGAVSKAEKAIKDAVIKRIS